MRLLDPSCAGKALAFAALLSLAGCKRGRIKQCNDLISVANTQASHLSDQMNHMSGDPDQLEALAHSFEDSNRRIAAVRITDPVLLGLSHDYETVMGRFVQVARSMATAARASNQEGVSTAGRQIEDIERSSTEVVGQINRYCQSL